MHICVVLVDCPACKARKGECCKRTSGHPSGATHYRRRDAAAKLVRKPGWVVVTIDKVRVRR